LKEKRKRRGTEKGSKAEALVVLSLRNSRRTPLHSPSLSLSVSSPGYSSREMGHATDNYRLYSHRPTTESGFEFFFFLKKKNGK